MWGKIMRNFNDSARHDFATVFIRNRECQACRDLFCKHLLCNRLHSQQGKALVFHYDAAPTLAAP